MQDIGFVHYWWRHDYKAAAAWFERGGNVPGAPWWLRSLAATTLAEGGDRGSSRLMWKPIRETADNDWLQHDAERHLLQLRALDDIDALAGQRSTRSRRQSGPSPTSWLALVRARVIPRRAPRSRRRAVRARFVGGASRSARARHCFRCRRTEALDRRRS